MNTIAASQKNRRERIADAMRIEWNGFTDIFTAELWLSLIHAIDFARSNPGHDTPIYFGGSKHTLTLTELENLCERVRQSYHAQQEAKSLK